MARRKTRRTRTRRAFAARATRTVYRTVGRARRSSRRIGRSTMGGWLPLSMKETALDFGVGAITPTVNSYTANLIPRQLTSWAGPYEDEARTYLVGTLAHKFGSGIIKDAGREMARFAVLSAGQETGAKFIGTSNGAPSSMSGVVVA